MVFKYNKLVGLMREKNISQETLSKAIGSSSSTLSLKLNNKAHFKQSEIAKICDVLCISDKDIGKYFFTT